MTVLSVREHRAAPASEPLSRTGLILAVRRLALDLDADGDGHRAFTAAMGRRVGRASHLALGALVMVLCGHGRRPFVVGHPRSPLPTVAERHILALIAAVQAGSDHEVEVRLATLLPAPWRESAESSLVVVAATLAQAGTVLGTTAAPQPRPCSGWFHTASHPIPTALQEDCQP